MTVSDQDRRIGLQSRPDYAAPALDISRRPLLWPIGSSDVAWLLQLPPYVGEGGSLINEVFSLARMWGVGIKSACDIFH